MLILQPTEGIQKITIAPRSIAIRGVITMHIRRDGDGKEQSILIPEVFTLNGFSVLEFQSNILEEDSTYYLEVTKDSELWYRDKIYVTSQTDTEMLTSKHQIGNGTIYKTYNKVDDNTYII
tara:strand:+ start:360 stop:722 length:363 start_codon:yes stop_codon:yes gene_type:complete